MGIVISTPNYFAREDQLAFPPEIIEKICCFLTPRDMCICREVCRSWLHLIAESELLSTNCQIVVENSEHFLQQLSTSNLPLTYSAFALHSLELTKRSQDFWNLYTDRITHLNFSDCAILPRMTSPIMSSSIEMDFRLGCPNLQHLGLRRMDKYFMMGGQYLQLQEFISLGNLISLDVSDNKYLSDRILFDILGRTKKLQSLDLSSCPVLFVHAVHRRFYPPSNERPPYSDNILSFETLVLDFLCEDIGRNMRELKLRSTTINSNAIQLISTEDCHELKANDFMLLIAKNWDHLTSLKLSTAQSKLTEVPLAENVFPLLEILEVDRCPKIGSLLFTTNMPKLKSLSMSFCALFETNLNEMERLLKKPLNGLTSLNLANCGMFISDQFLQLVIQNLKELKTLNLNHTSQLTDDGLEGLHRLTNLQSLHLSHCTRLGDLTWMNALRFRDLAKIDLSGCDQLTSRGLLQIASKCRSLEYLNILKCSSRLTSDTQVIGEIRNYLYRLKHFVF